MPSVDPTYLRVTANSARTATATTLSFLVANMFHMPESYWAPITTVVVMQSTLGAALRISTERLVRTVLGALLGTVLATYFPANLLLFGAGVFLLGIVCAIIRMDNAFRFAAITLAVVVLIARNAPPPQIALHRFFEVSVGIVVGLIITWVWPEYRDLSQAVDVENATVQKRA
jgi:uncharacterized membrane protein YccC